MLNAAFKTIKCDLDKQKEKLALHNERSNLAKPEENALLSNNIIQNKKRRVALISLC